jgi:acyl-coenzyme A synthetase/AMP-(fatty) acid ligase
MNLLEGVARAARQRPEHPALVEGAESISYAQLMHTVQRTAGALAQSGIARGDAVGLEAAGVVSHIVTTLALAHLGAVSVPLTAAPGTAAHDEAVRACRIKLLVHGRKHATTGACPVLAFEDLRSQEPASLPPMADVAEDDTWRIGMSSGTTGRPKAIVFSHRNAVQRVELLRSYLPWKGDERMMPALGIGLSYAFNHWLRVLYSGGTILRPVDRKPAAVLQALEESAVTTLVTTPALAALVVAARLRADSSAAGPIEHLQAVCLAGSAASTKLQQRVRRHLCPNIWNTYGATETGMIAIGDPELLARDPSCAGRVLPWVEAQAIGEDGEPLPPGNAGLLSVRSPTVASGYLDAELGASSRAGVFRDGWYFSADIGAVSAEGLLHLSGRDNDVINLAGVKVDPHQIEDVLQENEGIVECAVVALPWPAGLPQLFAAVVAEGAIDRRALIAECSKRLGPRLAPRAVVRVKALPRNDAGKLVREELVRMLRKHLEAARLRRSAASEARP